MRKNRLSILLVFVFTFFAGSALANIIVLNGLTHENNALPGETYRTNVEIQNVSEYAKGVKVYKRDYWYHYSGDTKHDAPGTLERSNANWISFQPELLNLEPNEKAVVTIEVTVPDQSELNGSYWSVLMVEGIVPPDTTSNNGVSITTTIRYAVQLISHIGNTGNAHLEFAGMDMSKQEETNFLNVYVENKGEKLLKPELSLELFDDAGNSIAVIKAEKRKTLPGTSIRIGLNLEGIKPGKYSGVIIADCGNDDLFGTNVSFEVS